VVAHLTADQPAHLASSRRSSPPMSLSLPIERLATPLICSVVVRSAYGRTTSDAHHFKLLKILSSVDTKSALVHKFYFSTSHLHLKVHILYNTALQKVAADVAAWSFRGRRVGTPFPWLKSCRNARKAVPTAKVLANALWTALRTIFQPQKKCTIAGICI